MINPMNGPDLGVLRALALVGQLGLIVMAPTIVGLLLGRQLGQMWGSPTFFTIAGLLLGLAGGGRAAYRLVLKDSLKKSK